MSIKKEWLIYKKYRTEINELSKYKILDNSADKEIRKKMAEKRKWLWMLMCVVIFVIAYILKELNLIKEHISIILLLAILVVALCSITEAALISIFNKFIWIIYLVVPCIACILWMIFWIVSNVIGQSEIFGSYNYYVLLVGGVMAFVILLCRLPVYMIRELKSTQILIVTPILTIIMTIFISEYINFVTLLLISIKLIMDFYLDKREKRARKKLYGILLEEDSSISYDDLKACVYYGGTECLDVIIGCSKTRNVIKNNEKIY